MHTEEQSKKLAEKKNRIYTTAMKMFKERGFEETTIRDICKESNVSISSFYNFYGDKLGILLEFCYKILAEGAIYLKPTKENLSHPYQSICNYFLAYASYLDAYGKDVAWEVISAVPKLLRGPYETLSNNAELTFIGDFLEKAKDYETVPRSANTTQIAEFLIVSTTGISSYWAMLTENGTYSENLRRMLPTFISAVSDEKIKL